MRMFWLFFPVLLWSQCADYTVRFSVFGTIGSVQVCLTEKAGTYVMDIDGRTAGLAAILSNNRREHVVSQGRVGLGVYRPDVFVYDYRTGEKTRFIGYYFDHRHKSVPAETILQRHETKKHFDALSFSFKKSSVEAFSVRSWHHRYLGQDVITLFLNRGQYIGRQTEAIGLGSKMERFEIMPVSSKRRREYAKRFELAIHECYAFKVADKDAGTDVCLDGGFFPVVVVIRNILIFGDIVAVRDRAGSPK